MSAEGLAVLSAVLSGTTSLLVGLLLLVIGRLFNRVDAVQKAANEALHDVAAVLTKHGEDIARLNERTTRYPWDIDRREK